MTHAALYPMRWAVAVAVLSFAIAPSAVAAEDVGRVLTASGTITASTPGGGTRVLSDDSRVYEGEIIETRDGRVQIRFIDGGLMSLDAGTRFEIEQYEQRDAAAGDPDDGGSVFMRLFRGALRTITGTIGDGEMETYNLETPVATVGIRGTQFSLAMCEDGSCGAGVDDGLYGHIGEGRVIIENGGGDGLFGSGSFFRVADFEQRPLQILQPPGFVLRGSLADALAGIGDVESGEGARTTADGVVGRVGDGDLLDGAPDYSESDLTAVAAIAISDQTPLEGAAVASGFIGSGISDGGACTISVDVGCAAAIDSFDSLVSSNAGSRAIVAGSGADLAEFGAEPSINARWGRWSGETIVDGSTTSGDFLWAYSNQPSTAADLASAFGSAATFVYTASSGPSPVGDQHGTDWAVTNLSVTMDVDLGNAVISANAITLDLQRTPSDTIALTSNTIVVIDPGPPNNKVGFQTLLVDSTGGFDDGDLNARFAGSGADGLLVQFKARNNDSGGTLETVQGTKILLK